MIHTLNFEPLIPQSFVEPLIPQSFVEPLIPQSFVESLKSCYTPCPVITGVWLGKISDIISPAHIREEKPMKGLGQWKSGFTKSTINTE